MDTMPKGRDLHGKIPEACRGPPSRVPLEPVCAHTRAGKGAAAGEASGLKSTVPGPLPTWEQSLSHQSDWKNLTTPGALCGGAEQPGGYSPWDRKRVQESQPEKAAKRHPAPLRDT